MKSHFFMVCRFKELTRFATPELAWQEAWQHRFSIASVGKKVTTNV
jgi:hypothetical protein